MGKQTKPLQSRPLLPKYRMRISRLTVDKLGVKLYDRVSAAIAELVANSYDADATKVTISAPMAEWLAEKHEGTLKDKGYTIEVVDNGTGMTPEEVNDFYLVVGAERRKDPRRGDLSRKFKRKVMGRKGVGKLAPLGICERIEVITSGGERMQQGETKGYLTAHFTLDRSSMMQDDDAPYFPKAGPQNGTLQPKTGTTIRMSQFDYRHVPKIEDFDRQLAQRFGVKTANWEIILRDSEKTAAVKDATRTVGDFDIVLKSNTKIEFREKLDDSGERYDPPQYGAFSEDGEERQDVTASFEHEGRHYPVTGWMGYSKLPYHDDLMAGVRIYCRGKIAAQTSIFRRTGGFTGEYDIRSYLVGVLNADWLDEEEDLIRTDRQDILWSFPLGKAFETWGQNVVKVIGALTRQPMRIAAWDLFKEQTHIEDKVRPRVPGRAPSSHSGKDIGDRRDNRQVSTARGIGRQAALRHFAQTCDAAWPAHYARGKADRGGGDAHTLEVVTNILRIARVAELSSFGRIADDRVKVIKKVAELKEDTNTMEEPFQALIEQAPWLINPQWSPISDNQSLTNLKNRFVHFYKEQTGETITIFGATPHKGDKRSAFVMTSQFVMTTQDDAVEIIEIKRPGHALQNMEMDRIVTYHDTMDAFFHENKNEDVLRGFEKFHITLVCDKVSLKGAQKVAFDGMQASGGLTQVSWGSFLNRTRKMHEAFLKEAERQKLDAGKK